MSVRLENVFGIADLQPASYVDRGDLDDRVGYLLRTKRHLVIHGDSKQGKSWLRERCIPDAESIRVQCHRDATTSSLLQQALGLIGVRAEIRQIDEKTIGGTLDLGASGEVGSRLFAKGKAEGRFAATAGKKKSTETTAVGKTPADLSWIAWALAESGKRLVLEDFHYLSLDEQRTLSFIIKALGEYDVLVVVVGVWAESHLLTFHNGDLSGRVEDIRLEWSGEDLGAVLDKGSAALNLSFSDEVRSSLIADSVNNVGLLQRLAERTCIHAGVLQHQRKRQEIDTLDPLVAARADISEDLAGRFSTFRERLTSGKQDFGAILKVLLSATDEELLEGLSPGDMASRVNGETGKRSYNRATMRKRLMALAASQAEVDISPPVISYDLVGERVFLVDRAFLFYRKHSVAASTRGRRTTR